MLVRIVILLAAAVALPPAFGAYPPPSVRCDGVFCRETQDREWHVRIVGELASPAGMYFVVTDVNNKVIARGKIPFGKYPPESPFTAKVPRDGVTGDYLLTLFGTQRDFAGIPAPYTDLPLEVYGRTFFQVQAQGTARSRPYAPPSPGGLYFQLPPGVEEVTITQGIPWSIHTPDGRLLFDAAQQSPPGGAPKGSRQSCVAAFKGIPGNVYLLGHSLYWFFARPQLYLAISPERWFLPDPRLQLDPAWWRQNP